MSLRSRRRSTERVHAADARRRGLGSGRLLIRALPAPCRRRRPCASLPWPRPRRVLGLPTNWCTTAPASRGREDRREAQCLAKGFVRTDWQQQVELLRGQARIS